MAPFPARFLSDQRHPNILTPTAPSSILHAPSPANTSISPGLARRPTYPVAAAEVARHKSDANLDCSRRRGHRQTTIPNSPSHHRLRVAPASLSVSISVQAQRPFSLRPRHRQRHQTVSMQSRSTETDDDDDVSDPPSEAVLLATYLAQKKRTTSKCHFGSTDKTAV